MRMPKKNTEKPTLPTARAVAESDHPIRQCAWCGTVADASGAYVLPAAGKLRGATHGVCPTCRAALVREIDATPAMRSHATRRSYPAA